MRFSTRTLWLRWSALLIGPPESVRGHPASGIDEAALAQVQADLRRRILRAFVGRGLIERVDAKEMLGKILNHIGVDSAPPRIIPARATAVGCV